MVRKARKAVGEAPRGQQAHRGLVQDSDLASALTKVARGERVLLPGSGRPVAAVITYEDFQHLRAIEELEDELDIAEADRITAENGPRVSLKELKAKLRSG